MKRSIRIILIAVFAIASAIFFVKCQANDPGKQVPHSTVKYYRIRHGRQYSNVIWVKKESTSVQVSADTKLPFLYKYKIQN